MQHSQGSIIYRMRVWLSHLFVLLLLTSLCSCANYKVVSNDDDRDFWGGSESEIWISGERQKIYALTLKSDGILANYLGIGGTSTIYVLKPPPWSRAEGIRLYNSIEGWQKPWRGYPEIGLSDVSEGMGVPSSRHRRYLISVNPLVIAISNESVSRIANNFGVYLIDRSNFLSSTHLYILAGEYPAHAELGLNRDTDDFKQIRKQTRIVATDDMTLVEVLNSPELWQEQ